jgi:hypothetical protein
LRSQKWNRSRHFLSRKPIRQLEKENLNNYIEKVIVQNCEELVGIERKKMRFSKKWEITILKWVGREDQKDESGKINHENGKMNCESEKMNKWKAKDQLWKRKNE